MRMLRTCKPCFPPIAVLLFAVVLSTTGSAAQTPWKITRVVEATKVGPEAGLGDEIVVTVQPFQPILDKANCVQPASQGCIKQDIILFLDGRPPHLRQRGAQQSERQHDAISIAPYR